MTVPLTWPRDGAPATALVSALREVLNKAVNVAMPGRELVAAYVHWATESATGLLPWLSVQDIDRLVRTPTYWAALSMTPGTEHATRIVNDEMFARRQELERAVDSLEAFQLRMAISRPTTFVLPDTNVILEHPGGLPGVDWPTVLADYLRPFDDVRAIIPLAVVDELDSLKRVHRTEKSARTALRIMYSAFGRSVDARPALRAGDRDDGQTYVELLMESPAYVRLPRTDDELVRVASGLSSFTSRPVVFMTYDTGAAFRARAAGVPHVRLTHKSDQ